MGIATFAILCILGCVGSAAAAPNCLESFTSTQCQEYTDMGGGRLVLNSLTDPNMLTEDEQANIAMHLANVSNEYVIVNVEPQHVVITKIDVTAESDNKVTVHFFVANPTGSTFMPVAFRSHELYLMLKLNKDKLETGLNYQVSALEPDTGPTLPLPTWALAIVVYAALVLVVGLIYIGTKDMFKQREEERNARLRKVLIEDGHMEMEPEDGGTVDVSDGKTNGKAPADMYRDTQVSLGVQATREDIANTMGITFATVEKKGGAAPTADQGEAGSGHSPPPERSAAPPAYREVTAGDGDAALPAPAGEAEAEAARPAAAAGESLASEAEASAALEGAVNAAFEGDGDQDADRQQTTNL